jgi:G6PDH family F420-dependent oxidoreductase
MGTTNLKIGVGLSSEEHGPRGLLSAAEAARTHGFDDLAVTDHFHPWIDEQGHSPFVWSVLGALSQADGRGTLGTAVTCPTVRIHPAIVAQAAATTAVMAEGRFWLGVGTGENLNEHILGDRWPPAPERLRMLEESIEVMRLLWTGEEVTFDGEHYVVEDARIYDLPSEPPKVMVSAFGPAAAASAAKHGDGLVTTAPDADTIATYRENGGRGEVVSLVKVCWADDEAKARETYHRLWPTSGVPGQLSQDLRTPALFEQAIQVVREEDSVGSTPVGPDPEPYVEALRSYSDAGVDVVYVQQVGSDQEAAFRFLREEVLPRLAH